MSAEPMNNHMFNNMTSKSGSKFPHFRNNSTHDLETRLLTLNSSERLRHLLADKQSLR